MWAKSRSFRGLYVRSGLVWFGLVKLDLGIGKLIVRNVCPKYKLWTPLDLF
jgi:hypothetical protein